MKRLLAGALSLVCLSSLWATSLWSSSSKDFGESSSDFTLREIERRPQSSVLRTEIKNIGGSVGSSMITVCMLMQLAEVRGGFRYLVQLDRRAAQPDEMIVGFSHQPIQAPQLIDAELPASAKTIDLNLFGPDLNRACRTTGRGQAGGR